MSRAAAGIVNMQITMRQKIDRRTFTPNRYFRRRNCAANEHIDPSLRSG